MKKTTKLFRGGAVVALVAVTGGGAGVAFGDSGASPSTRSVQKQAVPGKPVPGAARAARVGVDPDPSDRTLRQLAKPSKLKIGVAVNTDLLSTDATYTYLARTEFSSVTPENVMKWEVVEPQQGKLDFSQADKLVRFAERNHQVVRGHTLVWHSQLPAWLTEGNFTKAELRAILKKHINDEMGHFRGRISAWDVVNEAFNEDGTLRDSLWLQKLGPGYIEDAFRWAHQADPKAKLYYNDYNIEGVNPKSNAVYALIKKLKAKGVPVQGVGLQSHFDIQYPYPPDLAQNMQRFADLGLDVAVTEADVRMDLPVDPTKLQAQAGAYDALMTSCLQVRRCVSFTFWGISDTYSWIPGVFPGQGAALLWDGSYQTKPAYDQLRRILGLVVRPRS